MAMMKTDVREITTCNTEEVFATCSINFDISLTDMVLVAT